MTFDPGPAGRAPLPRTYLTEPRYLKYRDIDHAKPYAAYFEAATRPVQDHVQQALVAGMAPTEFGYGLDRVAERLARPGYDDLETGWTRLRSGVVMVSVLTDLPGNDAAMWDWWFGWHGCESARYKLWNPDSHQFATLAEDRTQIPGLTDKQRYIGNVSFVDEYIGGVLQPLAIRFVDPRSIGITEAPDTTHICARVSLSTLPVAFGWLVHQIRPTDRGAEMRSRFFLNTAELLHIPRHSLPPSLAARLLTAPLGRLLAEPAVPFAASRLLPATIGTDMVFHCAAEMNHLAQFLPALHKEFGQAG